MKKKRARSSKFGVFLGENFKNDAANIVKIVFSPFIGQRNLFLFEKNVDFAVQMLARKEAAKI